MGDIITVPKKTIIGEDGGPEIRPDTEDTWWQKVSETSTSFVIEIREAPEGG